MKIKAKDNQRTRKGNQPGASLVNLPNLDKINVRKDMAQELGVSDKTYGELKTINKEGTDTEDKSKGKDVGRCSD